jgi:hypothetical protein
MFAQVERRQRNIRLGTLEELPSKSAARKRLSELLKNAPPKTGMSFQQLAERWEKAEGSTIKATTLQHYKNALRAYVLPKFEERKITEINREDIQKLPCGESSQVQREHSSQHEGRFGTYAGMGDQLQLA